MGTPEFEDRPTLREWKRHVSRLRWQRRLQRAPQYVLGQWAVLVLVLALLIFALIYAPQPS